MAIMVTSFRDSLDEWLVRILPADLYVRANVVGDSGFVDEKAQQAMAQIPGIARIEFLLAQQIMLDRAHPRVTLLARDLNARGAENVLPLVSSVSLSKGSGDAPVWISEATADLYALAPGQRIEIPLGRRTLPLFVAGIWRDYARQSGALVIDRALYIQSTGDRLVTDAAIWLVPGADPSAVIERLRSDTPGG